jgi:hypothetical protein
MPVVLARSLRRGPAEECRDAHWQPRSGQFLSRDDVQTAPTQDAQRRERNAKCKMAGSRAGASSVCALQLLPPCHPATLPPYHPATSFRQPGKKKKRGAVYTTTRHSTIGLSLSLSDSLWLTIPLCKNQRRHAAVFATWLLLISDIP